MKKSIKPQFIINNERIIERRVIANEFNRYFVSLASKLNERKTPVTNNFGDFLPSGNMQSMFMEDCTGFEISTKVLLQSMTYLNFHFQVVVKEACL